jgi:hypothetical protein
MKSVFLSFLCALLVLSCKTNKPEQHQQITTEFAFISEVLRDTSVIKHKPVLLDIDVNPPSMLNIPGDTTFSKRINYLSYLLDEKDTLYLRSQLALEKSFTLESLASGSVKVLANKAITASTDSRWEYLERIGEAGYYSLSKPIFDKESTKAYVKVSYYCGEYCGGGMEILFIKTNNKWIVERRLGGWVI